MFKDMFENVKKKNPLVHCITNYVTVNDCANIVIACGGSPIMADDKGEVEEITSICNGLTLNIGTLNQHTIPAMLLAGKQANKLNHPVLLDPVGAGASNLRTATANHLLEELDITTVRGNISEIKTLALGDGTTKGVDANIADIVTEDNLEQSIEFAKGFAKQYHTIVAITGAIDIVCDAEKAYIIRNGHPMMSQITGSGCMLSALVTAYLSANLETPLDAVAAAITIMGICGELAYEKLEKISGGNATYRNLLIDEIYLFNSDLLERSAKYEVR